MTYIPRRAATRDWSLVGWPYHGLYPIVVPWHNRLCRVRARGVENVPDDDRGLVLISNHLGNWDPLLEMTAMRRPVRWLGKKEVFVPPWDKFLRAVGVIKVDRQAGGNREAFAEALATIEKGGIVGVFPEGGRALHIDENRRPHTGFARLALLSGAPVLPVAILTDRFWSATHKVPRVALDDVPLAFGKPIPVRRDEDAANDPDAARKVTEDLWAVVTRMVRELRKERGDFT
ncbi:MAG: lysophospholipid acyltransferase family protein [Thermoplasmatota archaeon]